MNIRGRDRETEKEKYKAQRIAFGENDTQLFIYLFICSFVLDFFNLPSLKSTTIKTKW